MAWISGLNSSDVSLAFFEVDDVDAFSGLCRSNVAVHSSIQCILSNMGKLRLMPQNTKGPTTARKPKSQKRGRGRGRGSKLHTKMGLDSDSGSSSGADSGSDLESNSGSDSDPETGRFLPPAFLEEMSSQWNVLVPEVVSMVCALGFVAYRINEKVGESTARTLNRMAKTVTQLPGGVRPKDSQASVGTLGSGVTLTLPDITILSPYLFQFGVLTIKATGKQMLVARARTDVGDPALLAGSGSGTGSGSGVLAGILPNVHFRVMQFPVGGIRSCVAACYTTCLYQQHEIATRADALCNMANPVTALTVPTTDVAMALTTQEHINMQYSDAVGNALDSVQIMKADARRELEAEQKRIGRAAVAFRAATKLKFVNGMTVLPPPCKPVSVPTASMDKGHTDQHRFANEAVYAAFGIPSAIFSSGTVRAAVAESAEHRLRITMTAYHAFVEELFREVWELTNGRRIAEACVGRELALDTVKAMLKHQQQVMFDSGPKPGSSQRWLRKRWKRGEARLKELITAHEHPLFPMEAEEEHAVVTKEDSGSGCGDVNEDGDSDVKQGNTEEEEEEEEEENDNDDDSASGVRPVVDFDVGEDMPPLETVVEDEDATHAKPEAEADEDADADADADAEFAVHADEPMEGHTDADADASTSYEPTQDASDYGELITASRKRDASVADDGFGAVSTDEGDESEDENDSIVAKRKDDEFVRSEALTKQVQDLVRRATQRAGELFTRQQRRRERALGRSGSFVQSAPTGTVPTGGGSRASDPLGTDRVASTPGLEPRAGFSEKGSVQDDAAREYRGGVSHAKVPASAQKRGALDVRHVQKPHKQAHSDPTMGLDGSDLETSSVDGFDADSESGSDVDAATGKKSHPRHGATEHGVAQDVQQQEHCVLMAWATRVLEADLALLRSVSLNATFGAKHKLAIAERLYEAGVVNWKFTRKLMSVAHDIPLSSVSKHSPDLIRIRREAACMRAREKLGMLVDEKEQDGVGAGAGAGAGTGAGSGARARTTAGVSAKASAKDGPSKTIAPKRGLGANSEASIDTDVDSGTSETSDVESKHGTLKPGKPKAPAKKRLRA